MPDLEADLYNLTMSEEAQPLLDAVTKHITDNVSLLYTSPSPRDS